ncbi:MAG: hypothetical protein RSD28_06250 [Lachnospiraceae bacterium]
MAGLFSIAEGKDTLTVFDTVAYFKRFREYFLTISKLEHIHLFVSRNKVFDKEDVLQETIIIKVKKTEVQPAEVIVTSSQTNNDFENVTEL